MLGLVVSIIYLIITIMFAINLSNMIARIKNKSADVSPLSVLATISLVVQFTGLTFYFVVHNLWIVLICQIFLVSTMLYIRYRNKVAKDAKGKKE